MRRHVTPWKTHSEISEGCFHVKQLPALDEAFDTNDEQQDFSANWIEDMFVCDYDYSDSADKAGTEEDGSGEHVQTEIVGYRHGQMQVCIGSSERSFGVYRGQALSLKISRRKIRFAKTRGGAVIEHHFYVDRVIKGGRIGQRRSVPVVNPKKYTVNVQNGTFVMVRAHVQRLLLTNGAKHQTA